MYVLVYVFVYWFMYVCIYACYDFVTISFGYSRISEKISHKNPQFNIFSAPSKLLKMIKFPKFGQVIFSDIASIYIKL